MDRGEKQAALVANGLGHDTLCTFSVFVSFCPGPYLKDPCSQVAKYLELAEELATFKLEEFRSLLPAMHEMHRPPHRSVQDNEAFDRDIVEMLGLILGVYSQWVKNHEREELGAEERRMHDEMVQFFRQYGFRKEKVDF